MNDNNTMGDFTAMVFNFLSLKVKLIIIGIIIGVFFIMLLPVIIMASFGGIDTDDSNSNSVGSSIVGEQTSDTLYQYMNATFPMPFEVWDNTKDVITSKFSKSRTLTVNGVTQTKAHTRN